MIDTHCHLLPKLDDGPSNWAESLDLVKLLVKDGITSVIATPHQLGMFDNAHAIDTIRLYTDDLNTRLKEAGVNLMVYPGAEVRVDMRIGRMLSEGRLVTLADQGKMLLLELPSDVLIDITGLIKDLKKKGLTTVIAHAERLLYLQSNPGMLSNWREAGVEIQITAAGLLGDWGSKVSHHAWQLVLQGHASLLSTDAHDNGIRRPRLQEAAAAVSAKLGGHITHRLTVENPQNIIDGKELVSAFKARAI